MAAPSHSKGSRPVAVVRPEIHCKGSACNPLPLNPANRQECHQDKIAMDCIETLSCDGHGDGNEQEEKEARDLSEIFERTKISDKADKEVLRGLEEPSKEQKMHVAKCIGKDWKALCRHLISRKDLEARLDDIEAEQGTSEDKCFSVFSLWERSSQGGEYNVKELIQALENLPRRDILDYFKDYKPDEKSENEICAEDYHCEPKCTGQSLESGNKGIQNTNGKDSPYLVVGINASPSPTWSNFNCHGNEDVEGRRKEEILLQNGGCLIAELGRKGIKELARYLDPQHPNGNWKNVGRNSGVPEPTLKRIEDKRLIQFTPAFKILEILPHYSKDLTVLNVINKLESDDMHQCQIADKIRKSGKRLNGPFAMMDVTWKEQIADSLMTKSPALGSWKDLADLCNIPYHIVKQVEEAARGERESHSHTEGLILALAGRQANFTMENLAVALGKLPRKDVAEEVRRMIGNWNEYKIKK